MHEGPADGDDEFGCTPEHLVLGGGSGEHVAVVLKDPAYAVATFIIQWTIWCEDNDPKRYSAHKEVFDRWDSVLSRDPWLPKPWIEVFNFAGWGADDYAEFVEHCASPAFRTPLARVPRKRGGLEEWLAASLGEFVFFSMPELGERVTSLLDSPREYVKPSIYRNVVLPPPGYPDYYGRSSNGEKVTWGNLAWRISRNTSGAE